MTNFLRQNIETSITCDVPSDRAGGGKNICRKFKSFHKVETGLTKTLAKPFVSPRYEVYFVISLTLVLAEG